MQGSLCILNFTLMSCNFDFIGLTQISLIFFSPRAHLKKMCTIHGMLLLYIIAKFHVGEILLLLLHLKESSISVFFVVCYESSLEVLNEIY